MPAIKPSSLAGRAFTWIGVQSSTGPFMQLGTDETGSHQRYREFWSDTKIGYSEIVLGSISSGDIVAAVITRESSGWRLHISDITKSTSVNFLVAYGKDSHFDQGEWLQEDESPRCTVDPYPLMSAVNFSTLQLNGAPPHLNGTDAAVLEAPPDFALVPSKVIADAFTLEVPTGLAYAYVRITEPFNLTLRPFVSDAQSTFSAISKNSLTAAMVRSEAVGAGEQLRTAAERVRRELRSIRLPSRFRLFADVLSQRLGFVVGWLDNALANAQRASSWTVQRFLTLVHDAALVARRLRHAIGLPELALGGITL